MIQSRIWATTRIQRRTKNVHIISILFLLLFTMRTGAVNSPDNKPEVGYDNIKPNSTRAFLRANTAPLLFLNNAALNYTENDDATQLDSVAFAGDPDGDADWDGGILTLQITVNYEESDQLSIPNNVVGSINVSGLSIRDGSTVFGTLSYLPAMGGLGPKFTVILNNNATNTRVQQLIRSLSYHSTSENPGVADRIVTVTATDKNSDTSTDTRSIAVTRTNDAPTLSSATAQTIPEDSLLTIIPAMTDGADVEGDALSIVLESGSNYTVVGDTIKPVANFSGVLTVPVAVSDGTDTSSTANMSITVTNINDTPTVIASMPDTTLYEDFAPVNFSDLDTIFNDIDNGTILNFTTTALQSKVDLLVKESNNVLVLISKKNVNGIDTVVVTASDGSLSVKDSIIVTINPVEDAPSIITPIPDTTLIEDFSTPINYRDLNTIFSDPDGDAVTFSVMSKSGKIMPSINNADSMLVLTAVADANGIDTVIVTAKDASDSTKDTLFVTITPVNDVPTLSSVTPQSIPEDSLLTITVNMTNAADVDEDILSIVLDSGANYSLVDDTVKVSENFIGTLTVPVSVTDGSDTTSPVNMTITVTERNDVPVIVNPLPDTTVLEDFSAIAFRDLNDVFSDEESGSALTFNVTTLRGKIIPSVRESDSVLILTALPNENDYDIIVATAYDGTHFVSDSMIVTITPVNDAPTLTSVTPQTMPEDSLLTITMNMTDGADVDGDALSFILGAGANYTVSGDTIVVDENYIGMLMVPVSITDGIESTFPIFMNITVTAKNDAPIVMNPLPDTTLLEDFTAIAYRDLNGVFSDEESGSALSFTVTALSGRITPSIQATDSALLLTPVANANGGDIIVVTASDGTLTVSDSMVVTITAVNDAPTLTTASDQTTNEEKPLTLLLSMTDGADIDNTLTNGSIIVEAGSNYTLNGATITPAKDFNGELTVPLRITDGELTTATVNMSVTVAPVNDAPTLTNVTSQTINEDESITILLSMTDGTDVDNTLSDASVIVEETNNTYTVNGTTVTPAANYSGTLIVPVRVTDGNLTSTTLNMSIVVNPVNDAPTLTTVTNQTINEDETLNILISMTDAADVDDILSSANILIDPGLNYTVNGSKITPAANFSGALVVPIRITDGVSTTETVSMIVIVNPVNDTPTLTSATSQSIAEETTLTILLSMTDGTDVDNTLTDASVIVETGSNYTVSGTTITPVKDFNGVLTVPIKITDGTNTSDSVHMSVTVTGINDAPILTTVTAQTISEDTPLTVLLSMTDAADVDNILTDTSVIVEAGSNYTVNGTTITPASNFFGTLTVPVKITDGAVTTAAVNMSVTVDPVNDVPTLGSAAAQTIITDTTLEVLFEMLEGASDVENSPLTIILGVGDNYTVSGTILTPAAGYIGALTVPISVSDGELTSTPVMMSVTVLPRNDAPVLEAVAPFVMQQDLPKTLTMEHVTATDANGDALSLIISAGVNYTISGTTISPTTGFVGTISVPFSVTDGRDTSNSIIQPIVVKAVNTNTTPTVTEATLTVEKNRTLTLLPTMVNAIDADGDGVTLLPAAGSNYMVKGAAITPDSGFVGDLAVPLRVTDGLDTSQSITIPIKVFEKKIGFHIGQVLVSDTFNVSVTPNPVPQGEGELFISAPQEEFDKLQVTIYSHTSDLMTKGEAKRNRGHFLFRWDLHKGRTVISGYSYVAILSFMKDGVIVKQEKKIIGIAR